MLRSFLTVWSASLMFAGSAGAAVDLVSNGGFDHGTDGWGELVSDADRKFDLAAGGGALVLTRTTLKAVAQAVQYNLKIKPLTRYRLSVTGSGTAGCVSLCAQSSKDAEFLPLSKAWAITSAPLPPSQEPHTETFTFDFGKVPDSAFLKLGIAGDDPGTYRFTRVALEEVGEAPMKDETVLVHLGDSITITSYLPFSQRVDVVLGALLAEKLPKAKVRQLDLGADGEYVRDLLEKRYDHLLKANYPRIDVAVIRYGANDAGKAKLSAEAFGKDLEELIDRLTADYPGIRIVLGTGPVAFGDAYANTKQYGGHWQAIRDIAKKRSLPLVDVYQRFETEAKDFGISPGNMHPTADGVKVMASAELEVLLPLLSEKKGD